MPSRQSERLIDDPAVTDGLPALEWKRRALAVQAERDRYREALERIRVCCNNGSTPENKLTFIHRVAGDALDA